MVPAYGVGEYGNIPSAPPACGTYGSRTTFYGG